MTEKWEYDSREGVIRQDGKLIAEVAGAGGSNYRHAEGERNARLIAAAPEMYEIFTQFVDWVFEEKLCLDPFAVPMLAFSDLMQEVIDRIDESQKTSDFEAFHEEEDDA